MCDDGREMFLLVFAMGGERERKKERERERERKKEREGDFRHELVGGRKWKRKE